LRDTKLKKRLKRSRCSTK